MLQGANIITPQWTFLESELLLRNAALDAELRLDRGVLIQAPADCLPAVSGIYREGTSEIAFEIERSHLTLGTHSSGPFSVVWWCIDLNAVHSGMRGVAANHSSDWQRLERGLGEGLQAFLLQMPSNGATNQIHLVGGFVDGTWHADRFRSWGNWRWYPRSQQRDAAWRAEIDRPASLASGEWRFEDQDGPKIIHAPSCDALLHEGGGPDLSLVNVESRHLFRYEGALGTHVLPVRFRLIDPMDRSMPRAWGIEYHPPSKRLGSPGDRTHPPTAGEAPMPEAQWRALDRFVGEALLHWPAHEATGATPAWIASSGSYHGGLWCGFLPRVIGLNTAITGLPVNV